MMNVSLRMIYDSIASLEVFGGDKDAVLESISQAIDSIESAITSMDSLQVCSRQSVDTLLGCMLAAESIAGVNKNGE